MNDRSWWRRRRALFRAAAVATGTAAVLLPASVARADTIATDLDGDGAAERVTATADSPALTVSATLSGSGRTVTRRFASAFVSEPAIQLAADVDGRAGSELFVHSGHISTFDTTAVLTVIDGALVAAGSFPVNAGLGDGYAMGFRCTRVAGAPGVVAYSFGQRRIGGRWERVATRHRWRGGRLLRVGAAKRSTVAKPSEAETGRGCGPRPAPVPVVLGERDNGTFAGIGVARPASFASAAGSETFSDLRWRRWGSRRAVAVGHFRAPRTSPGRVFNVRLVASDRGFHADCDDGRAYRTLQITLQGQRPTRLTICQRSAAAAARTPSAQVTALVRVISFGSGRWARATPSR